MVKNSLSDEDSSNCVLLLGRWDIAEIPQLPIVLMYCADEQLEVADEQENEVSQKRNNRSQGSSSRIEWLEVSFEKVWNLGSMFPGQGKERVAPCIAFVLVLWCQHQFIETIMLGKTQHFLSVAASSGNDVSNVAHKVESSNDVKAWTTARVQADTNTRVDAVT